MLLYAPSCQLTAKGVGDTGFSLKTRQGWNWQPDLVAVVVMVAAEPAEKEKREVVVVQSLRCVNCSFVTPLFKLCQEIHKPGRG